MQPDSIEREHDIIIVGGGVLGCTMAKALGDSGHKVVVIERDMSEPNRIVGELLQPGGVESLKELGLAWCLDEIDAIKEYGYVIHYKNQEVWLRTDDVPEAKGKYGVSFHHGRFVMNLRRSILEHPKITVVEGLVDSLLMSEDTERVFGVCYTENRTGAANQQMERKTMTASLTIVADGCFSKFRKLFGPVPAPRVVSRFYGLVLNDVSFQRPNHAVVCLTDPSPVLVYQIGTNETRMLIDIQDNNDPEKRTSQYALNYIFNTVLPQLPSYLQKTLIALLCEDAPSAAPSAAHLEADCEDGNVQSRLESLMRNKVIRKDAKSLLKMMPNSYLPPKRCFKAGVLLLGDAFNMRHPLTGGGMSVCFKDVLVWKALLEKLTRDQLKDPRLQQALFDQFYLERRKTYSFAVNVLANALYTLFAAPATNKSLVCLRKAAFDYFLVGGDNVVGPVGLLSIVTPNPYLLVRHFFRVAFYAIHQCVAELHFFRAPAILYTACMTIGPLIFNEIL